MSAATKYHRILSSPRNRKLLAKHALQLLFAMVILSLNAYIFQSRGDHVLVYSMILAIATILICAFLITCIFWYIALDDERITLGIHVFMSLLWLVDISFIMMLVSQWHEPVGTAHFEVFIARAVIGALEFILWFIPTPDLVIAIVNRGEDMFSDDHIPMQRIPIITTTRPTPPWDDVVSAPPQRGLRLVIPDA